MTAGRAVLYGERSPFGIDESERQMQREFARAVSQYGDLQRPAKRSRFYCHAFQHESCIRSTSKYKLKEALFEALKLDSNLGT